MLFRSRGDSDDGERVFVDRDGAANDGRVAVEVAVPVCIAEDDVRGAVFTLLVGRMKESAEVRLDIEGIEVVAAGHVRPGDGWVRTDVDADRADDLKSDHALE